MLPVAFGKHMVQGYVILRSIVCRSIKHGLHLAFWPRALGRGKGKLLYSASSSTLMSRIATCIFSSPS